MFRIINRSKANRFCGRDCDNASRRIPIPDDRVWDYIDRSGGPDACWPWTGAENGCGYGMAQWNKQKRKAHRVVYELVNGQLDPDLDVLHRCDNPPCCNPAHLRAGTHDDNMRDRDERGRTLKGEQVYRAQITADIARAIRSLYANGRTVRDIAESHKVSYALVYAVVKRKSWKHVA